MRGISVVGEEMAGSQRDEGMGDGGSEGGREGGPVALGVGSGWHGVKGRFPGQT